MNGAEIVRLRPSQVFVDRDHFTQRGFREPHARRLAKDYSPLLFGLGHVSRRSDGCYYVMDGQHRCSAALIAGNDDPVPFQVWTGLSIAEEAEKFEWLNKNRLAVSAFDRFAIGVTAKNPANIEIVRILENFGLTYGQGHQDGVVAAVDALVKIYEGRVRLGKQKQQNRQVNIPKSHLLSRTLQILTQAWGRDRGAFDKMLLNGIAALLYKHDTKLDATRLAQALSKNDSPARAVGKIKALREAARVTPMSAAVQYLEGVYNRRLSDNRKLA